MALQDALDYLNKKRGGSEPAPSRPSPQQSRNDNNQVSAALDYLAKKRNEKTTTAPTSTEQKPTQTNDPNTVTSVFFQKPVKIDDPVANLINNISDEVTAAQPVVIQPQKAWITRTAENLTNKGVNFLFKEEGFVKSELIPAWKGGLETIVSDDLTTREKLKAAGKAPVDMLVGMGNAVIDFGTITIPQVTATTALMIGDSMQRKAKEEPQYVPTFGPERAEEQKKYEQYIKNRANTLESRGKSLTDWAETALSGLDIMTQERRAELGITDADFLEPKNFGYNLGSGATSMAAAVGVTLVTKNPTYAGIMLGYLEGSGTYTEAKQKLIEDGLTEDKAEEFALQLSLVESAGIAVLEKIGIEALFKNYVGGKLRNMAMGAITETIQESSQTVWSNAIAKYGYDETVNLTDDLMETIFVTMPIGAVSGHFLGNIDPDQITVPSGGKDDRDENMKEKVTNEIAEQNPNIERSDIEELYDSTLEATLQVAEELPQTVVEVQEAREKLVSQVVEQLDKFGQDRVVEALLEQDGIENEEQANDFIEIAIREQQALEDVERQADIADSETDVQSVFDEIRRQEEPNAVDELKQGQDAILAALEGATQGTDEKKEDLKAPKDEDVPKTEPVEVEKAKKEDTEPISTKGWREDNYYYNETKEPIIEVVREDDGGYRLYTVVRGNRGARFSNQTYLTKGEAQAGYVQVIESRSTPKRKPTVDDVVAETLDNLNNDKQNKQNEESDQDNDSGDGVGSGTDTTSGRDGTSGQGTRRERDTSDGKPVLGGKRSGGDTRTGERSKQDVTELKKALDKPNYRLQEEKGDITIVKNGQSATAAIYEVYDKGKYVTQTFDLDNALSYLEPKTETDGVTTFYRGTGGNRRGLQTLERDGEVINVLGDNALYLSKDKDVAAKYGEVEEVEINLNEENVLVLDNSSGYDGDVTLMKFMQENDLKSPLDPMIAVEGAERMQEEVEKIAEALREAGYTAVDVVVGSNNDSLLAKLFEDNQTVFLNKKSTQKQTRTQEFAKQTTVMGRTIQTIVENQGHNLNDPEFAIKIEREGNMPLSIEKISENEIAMSQTYEQNGDIIRDPEIVFGIDERGQLRAKTIEHPPMVIMGKEIVGALPIRPNDPFITMWANNLKAQGFLNKTGEQEVSLNETEDVVEARNSEQETMERLRSGESVKATDLAQSMGIEVVNVGAQEQESEVEQEIAAEKQETMEEMLKRSTTIENDEVKIVEPLTAEEMETLEEFEPAGGKEKKGAEGRGLLDEYYTPEEIVEVLDQISRKYQPTAFKAGSNKVLEPAAGVGNLLAGMPANGSPVMHEINETAARILKLKNPNAPVYTTSFEQQFIDDRGNPRPFGEEYSTVIMNPPYGEHRGLYKGLGEEPNIKRYEDYFMKRGMDVLVPDGMMYAIVPSLFLRSSESSTAKKALAQNGELVEAIRFPNGAFDTTDIGTDLLVFRKNSEGQPIDQTIINERLANMSNDKYFEDNPTHILGTEMTRKGRFGEETFVAGSLAEAVDQFNNLEIKYKPSYSDNQTQEQIHKEEEEKLAKKKKKEAPVEKKIEQKEKTKTNKPKRVSKHDNPAKPKKAPQVPKVATYVSDKVTPEKDLLDLSQFSTATEEDRLLWDKVTATGELDIEVDTSKAIPLEINFMDGKWYNDFNYLQGNVAEKLKQLEQDYQKHSNDSLPEINYRSQKEKLEKILPEPHPIERMKLTPNSDFAHELIMRKDGEYGEEIPLSELFYNWLRTLPNQAFGNSSLWAIRGYINNNAVRGNDKQKNETERRTRRDEGNRLFRLFITENLSDRNKNTLLEAYNKKFNSFVRPDYSKVPLTAKIHPTFIDGKPLIIKPVQLEGIAFAVNKGTAILGWDVGVGKTLGAIITTAELLQRGWVKRPIIIVPSISVYNQWFKEIREVIPGVKINLLANLGGDFHGDINDLNIEEGSVTLMTEEGFKKLGFTDETYKDLTSDLVDAVDKKKAGITKRQEELDKSKVEETIGKGKRGTTEEIAFEDLGFDYIVYDELQNANHVFGSAKVKDGSTEFRGMTQTPSVAGIKLWLASQYVQRQNKGRGMLGLSATPFRNSVLEYFSVLSMVARERMKQMGVFNVNSFMTMFMDITTRPEFKADGQYADKTDVRSFINYQQFSKLLSEFIDFKQDNTRRPTRHQREHIIPETPTQMDYRARAQELFADTKNGGVLQGIKEMKMSAISPYLSIYNENRTPTLEEFVENSPKIKLLAKMIAKNLKDNPDGNQIVYSPIGTNVFGYIKDAIVQEAGLDPDQVQIISGKAANPSLDIPMKWNVAKGNRTKIQEDFNSGKVKVIIGSQTIEEGINLQRRTTDLYILSEPWNFTALRQVTGRLWRPGNTWKNVRINHMLTENSIDIFLLQKLETKGARFDATTEYMGDEMDTGEIDPGSMKWDVLTDPVQRTKMKYEELHAELRKEKRTLESELAYDARKVEKYMEARDAVFKTQESMKQHPDWDWLEGNLKRHKERLQQVLLDYKEKNIDLTTIDEKIAQTEAEVAKINDRIENLDKEMESALAEAQQLKVDMQTETKDLDLDRRLDELDEDNFNFYLSGDPHFKIIHDRDGNAQTWGVRSKINGRYIGTMSLEDVMTLNADFIRPREENLDEAISDVRAGFKSPSALPILVKKQKDGTYLIIDGHHRYVEEVMFGGQDAMFVTTNENKYREMADIEERVNQTGDKPMYKIKPGIMYHATLNEFDYFDDTKIGINTGWDNALWGHFFLAEEDRAIRFAEDTRKPGDTRPVQVKKAYLEMNKTLDLTTQGIFTIAEQAPLLVEMTSGQKGLSPEEALDLLNEEIGLGEYGDFMEAIYADANNKKLAQQYGYDSVVSEFGTENGQIIKEYVVFSSEQIKTEPVFKAKERSEAATWQAEALKWGREKLGGEILPSFKESTQEQQIARVEAYTERWNLKGGSILAVRDILTGDGTAEGVFWNKDIAISEKVSATVADHEFMHRLFAHMHNIDELKGFNRKEIFTALNGGKPYNPQKDSQRLFELNSLYFEEYVKRNDRGLPKLLQRFYAALQNFLYRLHKDYDPNVDLLRRFYAEIAFGSGSVEGANLLDLGTANPVFVGTGKNLMLDFGYIERKEDLSDIHRAAFKEVIETIEADESLPEYFRDETKKDINTLEFFTAQSHDLFLKDPTEFAQAKVYEQVGTIRIDNKRQLDNRFTALLKPYFELKGSQQAKVDRILMQGDRDMVEYNETQLQGMNLNAEEIKAYQDVRKAFKGAHAILLLKMEQLGIDKAEIDTFRNERTGYMPHKWKYKHVVKERRYDQEKEKWITTKIKDFKTKRLARKYAEEQGRANADAEVEYVVTTLNNVEQDFFIQQGLSFEAMKQVIELSSANNATKEQMTKAVRDLFKSKGFGAHYIKRWNIEGYQDTDMAEVIANYFSGFSGYVTKMEAAPKYYETLASIDPRTQPEFYRWVRDSITYEMGSQSEWAGVRTLAFAVFLANDLSYLAANATQNLIIGTAEISKYLKGSNKVTDPEARILKATTDWAMKRVTTDERTVIEELLEKGELGGQMVSELMGFKNNPLYNTINSKLSGFLYNTTAIVETNVNRIPIFLAARRIFIEQGMSEKDANEKALEVSNDVHFRYGKQHRPVMMRGKKGVLFIFLHYMRSFMYLMYRDLTRGEYLAFSRTLLWTTALGGTTSLPLAKLFLMLFGMVFKDYDDDEGKEAMEGWELMLKKGIPASMGADMSGRVGVELLAVNMVLERPNEVLSYVGAGGGLFKRAWQGVDMIVQGRELDAAAKLLPDMFANPIKAYQGWRIGVRSNAGVPLEDFNGELYKYNTLEAIIRATGITPTRESLLWDAKSKQWDVQDNVSSARGRVRGEIRYLVQTGDFNTAREVQAEAIEKGIMKPDMDYVKEFGKDIFLMEAYESLNTSDVRTVEKRLIEQVYPEGASDQQKNNLRKELAVFRVYGTDNKLANEIAGAHSNDDKLQLLLEARDTMGEEAVNDFIRNGRKEITLESGRTSEILISDDLLKRYKEAIKQ